MRTTLRAIAPAFLLAALLSLTIGGTASASRDQVTIFDASNEQSGEFGPIVRDRSLDELASIGVDVVRLQIYWRYVAPAPDAAAPPAGFDARNPNSYGVNGANFVPIDAVVKGARARGMEVLLVLSGQPPSGRVPRWASRDPSHSLSNPNPKSFQDFAYAVGRRYNGAAGSAGTVSYISIWNEPNSAVFLRAAHGSRPGAVPALYRELVIAGQTGLRDAQWGGKVLIGDLGPAPPGRRSRPVPFLRRVLCLNAKNKLGPRCTPLEVAGIAHHPYSFGRAPYQAALNSGQVSIGNLRVLLRLIAVAKRAGSIPGGVQLYNTEYGYPTRPDSRTGIPRGLQAEYLAIAEYLTYNMPGVASFSQYLLRDDAPGSAAFGFTSALCRHDAPNVITSSGAGCKPAFGAFRTALVVRDRKGARCSGGNRGPCVRGSKGGPVTIWGHIRPATGPTTAYIRFRDGGASRPLRAVRTDASGYFQFSARGKPGRTWAVVWNGKRGPFIRSHGF